jgi:hypothetical protein
MAVNVFTKDQDALQAICSLESGRSAAWEEFKNALNRLYDNVTIESIRTKDEVASRWAQGKAQAIEDILESIASARSVSESLKLASTRGNREG